MRNGGSAPAGRVQHETVPSPAPQDVTEAYARLNKVACQLGVQICVGTT